MEKCLSGMNFPKLSQAPKFLWILVNKTDTLDIPGGMDSQEEHAPFPGKADGRQLQGSKPSTGIGQPSIGIGPEPWNPLGAGK